ncbi:Hemolysin-type calcium-binding region [Thalassoporum mexicanum PCC 7367]|uniref:calcium-binding protein n=1 Tax=Thalassoporum mexicanum TaxID=3457544 RepID=UPI00029F86B7|nr:calcium-binding protein [Pseudanabaena sp. PCC 7367]AFY70940.1 Hemolysin-type calcium-binding region [Pseudanabaena sp. PCC 7367]
MEFFDLTNGNDTRTFNPGELGGRPVRSLDGDDNVTGSADSDDINGNQGNDTIDGGAGNDTFVRGGKGNDNVFGGAGDDPHVNGNNNNDTVDGGEGNDTVFGGKESDVVNGGNGNDRVQGDFGIDTLSGGAGADTFVLQRGKGEDVILDFSAGEDGFFLEEISPNEINLNEFGGNTIISDSVTGQPVATLVGVNQATVADILGVSPGQVGIGGSSAGAAGGSFNTTSLEPNGGWDGNVTITDRGDGWDAFGNVEILNNSFVFIENELIPVENALVFRIFADENDDNDTVDLEILDPSLGVGFAQSQYQAQEDQVLVVIDLVFDDSGFDTATLFINE